MTVESRKAPGPSSSLFGVRNLVRYATDPLGFFTDMKARHGDVTRIEILGRPWFLVAHPRDIEECFVKHSRTLGRDRYAWVLERTLGKGLLTNEGESWKRQRKLMSHAFTPRRIQSYAESMVRVAQAEASKWRDGEVLNLNQEMSRITMAVVAEVLFGTSVSEAEVVTVREALEVVNDYYGRSPEVLFMLSADLPTPNNRRLKRAVEAIDSVIYRILDERRRGPEQDDLLGTLLAAQDDAGGSMTDQQLRDEAVTLFLVGHETTSLALGHTLYLLSKYPDVERRVYAELADVVGTGAPGAEDVRRLPYTDRVLKEAMRLYSPAWVTGREALEDIEVGGYRIPKGGQVILSQWVTHRDPRWFPNPEAFDPERWIDDRDIPRYAYFPFGGGPRICIGSHFAVMEAMLLLAVFEQRARLELLPGERLELAPSVTLRPKGEGLRVRVVEREARGKTKSVARSGRREASPSS